MLIFHINNFNIYLFESNNPRAEEIKEKISTDSKSEKTKIAYLTFDDGPSENTPKILKILKKYDINATFFVVGNACKNREKYLKDIIKSGSVIGNHTYTHNYSNIYASSKKFKKEVISLNKLIKEATGFTPEIFRFPGGSNNSIKVNTVKKTSTLIKELNKLDMQYFDWNIDSEDSSTKKLTKDELVKSVLKQAKNKDNLIILFHDMKSKKATVEALPIVIEKLIEDGYTFEVLTKDSKTYQFRK